MPFITQGKTNWKFLLIVIILAIIVGAGALWYTKKQEQPYQPVEINKSETADWKTYKNEKYGYEIKYPKDWILDISGYPENISFKEPTQTFTGVGVNMDNNVYNNLEEVKQYWKEHTALEIEKAEEITINSRKGYELIGSIPAFAETPNSKIIFITFPLENKNYSIYIMCSSDINIFDTYAETFDSIINSFIIK